jgi:hypothetical protein
MMVQTQRAKPVLQRVLRHNHTQCTKGTTENWQKKIIPQNHPNGLVLNFNARRKKNPLAQIPVQSTKR